MPSKIRLPNKVIWALEDIGAMCRDSRQQVRRAIDRADKLVDLPLMTALARLSDDLATIERLARDARQGKYEGTGDETA